MNLQRNLYFLLLVFLITLSLIYLAVGAFPLSLSVLLGSDAQSSVQQQILFDLRLPRLLLAVLVGVLLAASGVVMQGLFRNPLADPSLIGVTAGASAGGSLVIVLQNSLPVANDFTNLWLVTVGAFVGGLVAVSLVYRLAQKKSITGIKELSVPTMLLAGIAVTAFASGFTNLLEFFSPNEALRKISLWKMGGLESASWMRVFILGIFAIVFWIVVPRYNMALNAFLLGESQAKYLGIQVDKIKLLLIALVAAAVGATVAVAGSIAFVGLIVPHMVRSIIGPNHRSLLPFAALAGAVLLVSADLLARLVVLPSELPVGLITVFLGAPFFMMLLLQRNYRFG